MLFNRRNVKLRFTNGELMNKKKYPRIQDSGFRHIHTVCHLSHMSPEVSGPKFELK